MYSRRSTSMEGTTKHTIFAAIHVVLLGFGGLTGFAVTPGGAGNTPIVWRGATAVLDIEEAVYESSSQKLRDELD